MLKNKQPVWNRTNMLEFAVWSLEFDMLYFAVWVPALKWPPGLEGAPGHISGWNYMYKRQGHILKIVHP